MFGFVIKMFIGLLSTCTIGSFGEWLAFNSKGPIICVSLNNQLCKARTILVNRTLFNQFTVSVNKLMLMLKNIDFTYCYHTH